MIVNSTSTDTAPAYTSTCTSARNSASSSRYSPAVASIVSSSQNAACTTFLVESIITAPPIAANASSRKATPLTVSGIGALTRLS